MYYIYMIRCADNSIYTGITTDLSRRFKEHSEKKISCAKYTMSHQATKIEAVWQAPDRQTASRLEYYIKKLTKINKEKLIADNQNLEKFFSEKLHLSDYERIVSCGF